LAFLTFGAFSAFGAFVVWIVCMGCAQDLKKFEIKFPNNNN